VHPKNTFHWILILTLLAGVVLPAASVRAAAPELRPAAQVTAFDLIIAMNTLRMAHGLPALVEDPIINAVAQSTAAIMAAQQLSWHIGNVSGRIASAGYGGGAKVWATENFAAGTSISIDEIMVMWADPSHMIPAVNPAYCHVGAGIAKSGNGRTYYVLQAAYISGKACGEYKSTGGVTNPPGGTTGGVSQVVVPVKIATPDADGKIFHVVQPGQSFWAIAVAYKTTIKDIETWNNLSKDAKLQIGQKLFIPGSNTAGYATPTPVGMVQINTPDPDGKIVHTVQSHQTLITISDAYNVKIETILALNGIQIDWPLQIGQKLLIYPGNVTPSPTPRPLTPVEKLTPASDGNYYHVVHTGETLSWIADLYEVRLADLMAWNRLNETSIIQPEQKLLLQVTPPATDTPTPGPPTATFTATPVPNTQTPTPTASLSQNTPTVAAAASSGGSDNLFIWFATLALTAGGLFLVAFLFRKKN
jgi:LysM repeat protein